MNKTIILDIDGTLLNSSKEIDKQTIEILREAERTHNIVLASGRHYWEMKNYADVLGATVYSISCDGQYIVGSNGEVLWENTFLAAKDLYQVFKVIGTSECAFFTNDADYCILRNCWQRILLQPKNLFRASRTKWVCLNEIHSVKKIEKIVLPFSLSCEQVEELEKSYCIHNYIIDGKCEILSKTVNKFFAIQHLCRMKNWDLNQTLFFGDDMNDYECFMKLPYTIAMGNAPEAIKKKATHVSADNDHSGVYLWLKTHLGNNGEFHEKATNY